MFFFYFFLIILIFIYIFVPLFSKKISFKIIDKYSQYNELIILKKEIEIALEEIDYELEQCKITLDDYNIRKREYAANLLDIETRLKKLKELLK